SDDFSEGFGDDGFGWGFDTFDERDGAEADALEADAREAETREAEARALPAPPAARGDAETLRREFAEVLNRAYRRTGRRDISASDLLDLVNREVNYEGAAYYEIPYDPSRYRAETREELANLIAQYLLIYSGGLDEFADDDLEPTRARMLVQLGTTGNIFTERVTGEIDSFASLRFPEGYRVRVAGIAIVEQAISRMISNAQFYSIAVSLTLVFFLVSITFRSLLAGILGLVPLGFTILVNFGLMGLAGINLDVSTAMVASIAIGIGIDYTIHFLSAYHREYRRTGDPATVERRVLDTTGRAILFNAVSVAAGFAVLLFSRFNPLMNMGALIAITMFTSSIAAMTILPVLLGIFKPRFLRREV
ncbi:MAG: RND family transporter, partial [Spirochaetaceae bacterium]